MDTSNMSWVHLVVRITLDWRVLIAGFALVKVLRQKR